MMPPPCVDTGLRVFKPVSYSYSKGAYMAEREMVEILAAASQLFESWPSSGAEYTFHNGGGSRY